MLAPQGHVRGSSVQYRACPRTAEASVARAIDVQSRCDKDPHRIRVIWAWIGGLLAVDAHARGRGGEGGLRFGRRFSAPAAPEMHRRAPWMALRQRGCLFPPLPPSLAACRASPPPKRIRRSRPPRAEMSGAATASVWCFLHERCRIKKNGSSPGIRHTSQERRPGARLDFAYFGLLMSGALTDDFAGASTGIILNLYEDCW